MKFILAPLSTKAIKSDWAALHLTINNEAYAGTVELQTEAFVIPSSSHRGVKRSTLNSSSLELEDVESEDSMAISLLAATSLDRSAS